MWAAENDHVDTMLVLLDGGSGVGWVDAEGHTVKDMLGRGSRQNFETFVRDGLECVACTRESLVMSSMGPVATTSTTASAESVAGGSSSSNGPATTAANQRSSVGWLSAAIVDSIILPFVFPPWLLKLKTDTTHWA